MIIFDADDPLVEDWKPINGFDGRYEVSSLGRVRSTAYPDTLGRVVRGKVLRNAQRLGGYFRVELQRDGLTLRRTIHLLVLQAFIGPPPEGMEGCHNDGNTSNNRLDNLRWDTHSANNLDKIQHGTIARGERNGRAKLTTAQIDEIRTSPEGPIMLARRLGVNRSVIHKIRRGEIWQQ